MQRIPASRVSSVPVDAGAVVDADPARLERIGRARRYDLTGQAARPGGVRHVPGGVDLLVLRVVEAGGSLETLLADRDR